MRSHYEYIVVLCCFLSLFVNIGLPSTSFAVYQLYIITIVGDAGASVILAVRILVSVAALVVVDRFYHVLGLRFGLALSMALTGAGFIVYSMAQSLPLFIAGAVLCGIAYGMGGMMATTMLVNRWFIDDIGTAVGVASVGSGVAGTIMPIVSSRIIEGVSLAASFHTGAALALVAALFVALFLRSRPSDMGLSPHRSKSRTKAQAADAQASGARTTTARVGTPHVGAVQADATQTQGRSQGSNQRTPGDNDSHGHTPGDSNLSKRSSTSNVYGNFALSRLQSASLMAAMIMAGAFSMGGVAYISILLLDGGFDVHFAAMAVSVAGLCLTAAKFLTGRLFDKAGPVVASCLLFAVLGAGLIALCVTGLPDAGTGNAGASAMGAGIALAGVACTGCGLSLGSVGISVWSLQLSSAETRNATIKHSQIAFAAGGFLMNLLPGPLRLLTGSYATSYMLMLVLAACSAVIVLNLYRKGRRSAALKDAP